MIPLLFIWHFSAFYLRGPIRTLLLFQCLTFVNSNVVFYQKHLSLTSLLFLDWRVIINKTWKCKRKPTASAVKVISTGSLFQQPAKLTHIHLYYFCWRIGNKTFLATRCWKWQSRKEPAPKTLLYSAMNLLSKTMPTL